MSDYFRTFATANFARAKVNGSNIQDKVEKLKS